MKQYVIASLLTPEITPFFKRSDWPLHLTLVGPFLSEHEFPVLADKLGEVCDKTRALSVRGTERKMFGRRDDVRATVIERTPALHALHNNILNALSGMITLKVPEHHRNSYHPHVSDRPHGKVLPGHTVAIESLSVIEIMPDKGVILATVPIV